jgi:hypothetical protein
MSGGNIGEVIATRQLYYLDEHQQKKSVRIIVGKPEPAPDSSEYRCLFQLIGFGSQHTQTARGHDSIQALQSALIRLPVKQNSRIASLCQHDFRSNLNIRIF